jgi:hypothetical protein
MRTPTYVYLSPQVIVNLETWFKVIQNIFRVFKKSTCDLCHYASKQFHNISVVPLTADRIFVRWIDNSFVEQVDDPAMYLSLYGVLWSLGIQYK